jgi:hypothetical protein
VVGDRRAREPVAPEHRRGLELRARLRNGRRDQCVLAPGERAIDRLAGAQDAAGSSPPGFDAEQHVGPQLQRLLAPDRLGAMPICAQRPLGRDPAVVERGLAHEVDLDRPVDAAGGPHEHVVGVLVERRSRVGGDRILPASRTDSQRVADDDPAGRRLP